MKPLNTELVSLAIERSDGDNFEKFALEFIQATEEYPNFSPNGGKKDCGADGYIRDEDVTVFFQVSIEKNIKSKINKTIDRLKECERNPKRIFYVTNSKVNNKDKEEDDLYDFFGLSIRLIDQSLIASKINKNNATISAFNNNLSRFVDFLPKKNDDQIISISNKHIENPEVYVFLMQELDSRKNEVELLQGLMDSLIFWALKDTDPDEKILMSKEDIKRNISNSFPWTKKIILNMLDSRLDNLSKKNKEGRKINHHRKLDQYVLPFETRQLISVESSKDKVIQDTVLKQIHKMDKLSMLSDDEKNILSNSAINVLRLFFENEGLRFSYFLKSNQESEILISENTINDRISDVLKDLSLAPQKKHKYHDILKHVMRNLFYSSTQEQRLYLSKLSRTYVFLFSLQAEPKIIEYFHKASSNFKLFVGTDLIVKAISEKYLTEENQLVRNLFKMCGAAGIKLILTETSLEGVLKHFIVTDNEFKNNITKIEDIPDLISYSGLILIRTYYYAKLKNSYKKSWKEFVSEFVSYTNIYDSSGKEELKDYIVQQFGMSYLSLEEMSKNITTNKIDSLSEKICALKDNFDLSKGISTTILSVYDQRKLHKECSTFPIYGYQTWWLTNETKILSVTTDLIRAEGSPFIMRPEFLLNFFSMSSSVADVKKSYETIFPSIIGIQMGNRLPDDIFDRIISKVEEWKDLEHGRCTALTKGLIDKLKSEYTSDIINADSLDMAIKQLELIY